MHSKGTLHTCTNAQQPKLL